MIHRNPHYQRDAAGAERQRGNEAAPATEIAATASAAIGMSGMLAFQPVADDPGQ